MRIAYVTDPLEVVRLVGATGVDLPTSHQVAFEDAAPAPREYFALAASARRSPVSIELDVPSNLRATGNGADYIGNSHQELPRQH